MDLKTISAFIALAAIGLSGCGDTPPPVDASKYETDVAEAAVRHLYSELPEIRGDKQIYTIVVSENLQPASEDFIKRFADLKLDFVSADELLVRSEDHVPYDPKSELSPIFFQITSSSSSLMEKGTVNAAWAHKRKFRKLRLTVNEQEDGKWSVSDSELIEESLDDSWMPDWQRKKLEK